MLGLNHNRGEFTFAHVMNLLNYIENIDIDLTYDYSLASMYGIGEMVQQPEENSEKSIVMLDDYNSDLHLVLDDDG